MHETVLSEDDDDDYANCSLKTTIVASKMRYDKVRRS